jgi:Ricin-type beta-trefoil lectin domain-like
MRKTAYLIAATISATTLAVISFSSLAASASTSASAAHRTSATNRPAAQRLPGAPAIAQPDSSAPYAYLKNYHSGKCLEVPGSSKTAGTQLDQWTCNGGANQLWRPQLNATGEQYVFINKNSNQCINVRGFSKSNGAAIQQWPCNWATAAPNEIFYPDVFIGNMNGLSWYEWAGLASNKCLNVVGNSQANGAKVQLWDCILNPSGANEWFAQPYA